MILIETKHHMINAAGLVQHDHIFVINGFRHSLTSSVHHPAVMKILAHYMPRHELALTCDALGKPGIAAVDGIELYFSISHVEDILLLAVSRDGDIGIDVEVIRERRYMTHIAQRYFDCVPKNIFDFYRAWTAREAFIKAIGSRISLSLAKICTAKDGHHLKIGLSTAYSHYVEYFSLRENFIAALCRRKDATRDVLVVPYGGLDSPIES